jgi:hypothetical protein
MNPTIWSKWDRYTDKNGRFIARILSWRNGVVRIEYRPRSKPESRPVRVDLPESFWTSPACGWTLLPDEQEKRP